MSHSQTCLPVVIPIVLQYIQLTTWTFNLQLLQLATLATLTTCNSYNLRLTTRYILPCFCLPVLTTPRLFSTLATLDQAKKTLTKPGGGSCRLQCTTCLNISMPILLHQHPGNMRHMAPAPPSPALQIPMRIGPRSRILLSAEGYRTALLNVTIARSSRDASKTWRGEPARQMKDRRLPMHPRSRHSPLVGPQRRAPNRPSPTPQPLRNRHSHPSLPLR